MRESIIIGQMCFLIGKAIRDDDFGYFAIGVIACCIYHAVTKKES